MILLKMLLLALTVQKYFKDVTEYFKKIKFILKLIFLIKNIKISMQAID